MNQEKLTAPAQAQGRASIASSGSVGRVDVERIVAELRAERPGSRIVRNAPDGEHVTEIVREDPTSSDSNSTAVAVIERSAPHHHARMKELYRAVRGELTLHVDDGTVVLREGDEFSVQPGVVHWAQSGADDPAWIEVVCTPAFTRDDLIPDA